MRRPLRMLITALLLLFICSVQISANGVTQDTNQEAASIPTFFTIEEYTDYISRFSAQSDFLTFEHLAELGDLRFHSFTHHSSATDKGDHCTDYAYDLLVPGGSILTFRITSGSIANPDVTIHSDFSNEFDLRTNEGVTGWRSVEDVLYYYDNSMLKTIIFPSLNNTISLEMTDGFANYPLDSGYLCLFLNCAEAKLHAMILDTYFSALPQWEDGYPAWKTQYDTVLERYNTVFKPLIDAGTLGNVYTFPFGSTLFHYVTTNELFRNLHPDVRLEDFLSVQVGVSTAEQVYDTVGDPHMTCGLGNWSDVYLTTDGYYIAFDYAGSDSLNYGYIQHISWSEKQDFETYRCEILSERNSQKQETPHWQIIMWGLLGVMLILSVTIPLLLHKRKNSNVTKE